MLQHVRARAHDAHVAFQHIDELRQLVDVRLAHDVSPARLARVILGGLQRIRLGIHLHASELVAVELLVVQPVSFLLEEHRSRHRQLRDNRHDNQDEGEERTQEEQGEHDVERPFQHLVACPAQRVRPQAQERHVADHVEVHPVVQVVVDVRHAVEMHQVVLAVIDNRPDDGVFPRRQTAEQKVRVTLFLQPFGYFLRRAQVRAFLREIRVRLEVEIPFHPESGPVLACQFVIQLPVVFRAAHQHHVAHIASFGAVFFQHPPGQDTENGQADTQQQQEAQVEERPRIHELSYAQDDARHDAEEHRAPEHLAQNLVGEHLPSVEHDADLHARNEIT